MMKCLAPLLLVASTIAPHAENCPNFSSQEKFYCDTFDENNRLVAAPPYPLSVKAERENGQLSVRTQSALGPNRFVVGQRMETKVGGRTIVGTAECGLFNGTRGRVNAAIFAVVANADGSPIQKLVLYPQGNGMVELVFGKKSTGQWGQTARYSCHPVIVPQSKPDPAPAQTPKPARR